MEITTVSTPSKAHTIITSSLRVRSVSNVTDKGEYRCIATDHKESASARRIINVLGTSNGFITIKEPTGSYKITHSANGNVMWALDYAAVPPALISLFDNHGQEIATENSTKYTFTVHPSRIVFEIKQVELKDAGSYRIRAENEVDNKEVKLDLVVEDKPTLYLEDIYVMEGVEAELVCKCAGYPASTITWSFTPCSISPRWPTCHDEESFIFDEMAYHTEQKTEQSQISRLKFEFIQPGRVTCSGHNGIGDHNAMAKVIIGDQREELMTWGVDEINPISMNDEVKLVCGALVYFFMAPIHWYKDNNLVEEDEANGILVFEENTHYSYRKTIQIRSASKEDSGNYECRAEDIESSEMRQVDLSLVVKDALAPHLDRTNMQEGETIVDLGGSTTFECFFSGIPKPIIRWYKDDELIIYDHITNPNATIQLHDQMLYIKYTKPEHQGMYKCVGENKVGVVTQSTMLELSGIPKISKYLLWGIPAVVLVLALAFLVLWFRYRKTRRVSYTHLRVI